MDVVHFTQGATDPLNTADAQGVRFVPLADGNGDSHVGCVHVKEGGIIEAPSLTHAAALLVVHGRVTLTSHRAAQCNVNIAAGVGCVFDKDEPYTLRSDIGAILLIVEAEQLAAHSRGKSSQRERAADGVRLS